MRTRVDLYSGDNRNSIRDEFRTDVWRIADVTPFEITFANRQGDQINIKSTAEFVLTRINQDKVSD